MRTVDVIRLSEMVWVDVHGIVHWRQFQPRTCCDLDVINARGRVVRSPHLLFGKVELPVATCLFCLASGALTVHGEC